MPKNSPSNNKKSKIKPRRASSAENVRITRQQDKLREQLQAEKIKDCSIVITPIDNTLQSTLFPLAESEKQSTSQSSSILRESFSIENISALFTSEEKSSSQLTNTEPSSIDNPHNESEFQKTDTDHSTTEINKKVPKMTSLTYTDIINSIPVFDGKSSDLDFFISTCSTINTIVTEEQKIMFISIIRTKFKGMALSKMEPLDELKDWNSIKKRLEEKFRKPTSYENAQDEISRIIQGRNEDMETYGNRFRLALYKLNLASKSLSENADSVALLRTANEKLALRKFEQNISNNNLKIFVCAKACRTIEEAIAFAIKREDAYKAENICNYCKKRGHFSHTCFQKQNNDKFRFNNPNFSKFRPQSNQNSNGNSSFQWRRSPTNNNFDKRNNNTFKETENRSQSRKIYEQKNAKKFTASPNEEKLEDILQKGNLN